MSGAERVKWAVIGLGKRMDARPGPTRDLVRSAFGVAASLRYTMRHRRLTTLVWDRRRQLWRHRWPEGTVEDVRWWRTPQQWSTHGDGYDMADLLWRHYRPGPGDVVVDVGAGNGGETFWLTGMVGPTGRVVAVEAAPSTYEKLDSLVRQNGWTNVESVHAALSSEAGAVTISESDDWVGQNVYQGGGAQVRALTMDALADELGLDRIDWLKMNIEGAERDAVLGMEQLAPRVRHLTIACHDFLGTDWGRSKQAVLTWLRSHGFTVVEHGSSWNPAAEDYVYAWRD